MRLDPARNLARRYLLGSAGLLLVFALFGRLQGLSAKGEGADSRRPKAVAAVLGTPTAGVEVRLDASGSTGAALHYRWIQTQGPAVPIDGERARIARFSPPAGPSTIAFALAVGNDEGVDCTSITLKIPGPDGSASPLRADAGPDRQVRLGESVVLSAARSGEKAEDLTAFRWLLVAAPESVALPDRGAVATFTPRQVGVYRFALIAARGERISEPDALDLVVLPPLPPPIGEVASRCLARVEGGPALAEPLAEAFEGVAGRISLYESYGEAYQEISRRLDAILPPPPARSAWVDGLIVPLSSGLIGPLQDAGLDLTRPESPSARLSDDQRKAIAGSFRAIAEGLRMTPKPSGRQDGEPERSR